MIMRPLEAFKSPIDGRPINSRKEKQDDMKRHGCVEYEPSLSPVKGGFRNKKFTEKHGLTLGDKYR